MRSQTSWIVAGTVAVAAAFVGCTHDAPPSSSGQAPSVTEKSDVSDLATIDGGNVTVQGLASGGVRLALRLGDTSPWLSWQLGGSQLRSGQLSSATSSPNQLKAFPAHRVLGQQLASEFEGVREEVIVVRDHVRQQWRVDAMPSSAQFTVRIPVPEGRWIRHGSTGHLFDVEGARWRYGNATWIDANGATTPIETRWENRTLVMNVSEEVLRASEYPALLDPIIGVEVPIGDPALELSGADSGGLAAASLPNGDSLAVWANQGQIIARTIDSAGNILGTRAVVASPDSSVPRDIACNATRCLLLVFTSTEEFFGLWLNLDGSDAGIPPIPLGRGAANAGVFCAEVEYSNGEFFSMFALRDNQPDDRRHYVARIADGGGAIAESVFRNSYSYHCDIADFGGQTLFMYGNDAGEIVLTDFDESLQKVVALSGSNWGAATAVVGNQLLVVDEYGARWLDQQLNQIGATFTPPVSGLLTATAVAGGVAIVANDSTENHLVVIDTNGTVTNDALFANPFPRWRMGATSNLIFAAHDTHVRNVVFHQFDQTTVGGPTPLSVELRRQSQVLLAARQDGGGLMAFWKEHRNHSGLNPLVQAPTRGNRQLNDASVLDTTVLASTFDSLARAFGTKDGVVLVGQWANLAYQLSYTNSTAPEPTGVWQEPNIEGTVGAWASASGYTHAAARVDDFMQEIDAYMYREGTKEGVSGFGRIGSLDGDALADRSFVVASVQSAGPTQADIEARWIDVGVVESAPIVVSDAPGRQHSCAFKWNDTMGLAVWVDERNGGQQLYATRIDLDGVVLDPAGIAIASQSAARAPKVAPTPGGGFVVAWVGSAASAPEQAYVSFIGADGEVYDPDGLAISGGSGAVDSLDLVTDRMTNTTYLAYVQADLPLTSGRALLRTLDNGSPQGERCDTDDQCANRKCVDGVCCAQVCGECEACDASGECAPVREATDDSCFGDRACSDDGICLSANGELCADNSECATGSCADGFCCDQTCDGSCERCDVTAGRCEVLQCNNFGCSEERQCLTECNSGAECATGFQCSASGDCVPAQAAPEVEATDGCTCTVVGPRKKSSTPTGALLVALGAMAWARRRREPAQRETGSVRG